CVGARHGLAYTRARRRPRALSARLIHRPMARSGAASRFPESPPRAGEGAPMNVLLLSMPDSFEHMPTLVIRMPNGALASLAGNVDPHHHVAIADLVLVQSRVRETVERLVLDHQPDVVGLSIMTFQRATALAIARLIKIRRPAARIVAGGYDPSLAPEAYEQTCDIDFIVRGEGERTLSELLRAIERDSTRRRPGAP